MKTKATKYAEAVARNLNNTTRSPAKMAKYRGYALEQMRTAMGVRKTDTDHDAALCRIANIPY